MSGVTERALASTIDRLKAENATLRAHAESRRLRAKRAVELLRETFTLRTNCNMVDDAAEDACAEVARLRHPFSECVTRWQAMSNSLQAEALAAINGYAMDEEERKEVRPGGKYEHYHWASLVLGVYANEPTNSVAQHVHPDSGCYACVSAGCDEEPVFCVEHAGVAVTIANQHAEQRDDSAE
jgi:hypothetical protein